MSPASAWRHKTGKAVQTDCVRLPSVGCHARARASTHAGRRTRDYGVCLLTLVNYVWDVTRDARRSTPSVGDGDTEHTGTHVRAIHRAPCSASGVDESGWSHTVLDVLMR